MPLKKSGITSPRESALIQQAATAVPLGDREKTSLIINKALMKRLRVHCAIVEKSMGEEVDAALALYLDAVSNQSQS